MSGRHAIVTAALGPSHAALAKVSVPLLEKYALRIGADLYVNCTRLFPDRHPYWEKFALSKFLQSYDRVAWIDIDTIVNPAAPSIFEAAPVGKFCAFDEGLVFGDRQEQLWKDSAFYGVGGDRIVGWPHKYFNVGVMVIEPSHEPLFKQPSLVKSDSIMPEQTYLNLKLAETRTPCHDLTSLWNGLHSIHAEGDRKRLNIVHYAGWPKTPDWVYRVTTQMKKDLAVWGAA
jgi:hypothetical protein